MVSVLGTLAVHFDRGKLRPGASPPAMASALTADCLAKKLPDLDELTRTIELPVCYEGEFAPDLEEVAERLKLSTQVPNDGTPIVLRADHQTTGGYPKIAEMASADMPSLAQLVPESA
jgi:hypothetical protein